MKRLILGFCGAAGAGKDTAAGFILDYAKRCGTARQIAFADPMRDMLLALGVPKAYMVERGLKEKPVPGFGRSYRQLAQTLGTEWGRDLQGPNFWVDVFAARVEKSTEDIILVTDVRFPNEEAWLRANGGLLVRVVRPGVAPVAAHASEGYVDQFEPWAELRNEGSFEDLNLAAVGLLCKAISQRVHDRNKQVTGPIDGIGY